MEKVEIPHQVGKIYGKILLQVATEGKLAFDFDHFYQGFLLFLINYFF